MKVCAHCGVAKLSHNNTYGFCKDHRRFSGSRKEESKKRRTKHKAKILAYNKYYNQGPYKAYMNSYVRMYQAKKLQAMPSWLSEDQKNEIREIYALREELNWLSEGGLHVDHIIPLQGKNVSGLHVPWNLQIIPATLNHSKSNKV